MPRQGNSAVDKVLVMGMLERGGKIRTEIRSKNPLETETLPRKSQ